MADNRHSQVSAGKALNSDQAAISRWLAGKARPSFEKMLEVARLSGGYVQVADWAAPVSSVNAEPARALA